MNFSSSSMNINKIETKMDFLFNNEKYDLAIKDAYNILSMEPTNKNALYVCCYIHYIKDELDKANHFAQEFLKLNQEADYIHSLYAQILKRKNDYHKALTHMNRALELDPNNESNYYNMALMFIGKGHTDVYKAIDYLEKCLRIDPNYQKAYSLLAYLYIEMNDIHKGNRFITKALNLNPLSSYSNRINAYYYLKVGDLDEAKESILKSLRLNPNDEHSQICLKEIDEVMKNPVPYYRQIKDFLDDNLRSNPNDSLSIKYMNKINQKLEELNSLTNPIDMIVDKFRDIFNI